jgi:dihydroxy-acid dehydratase
MPDSAPPRRRSRAWFDTPELYGWLRTAALRSQGFSPDAIADRPIIGICNTYSELTHCNAHLRQLADAVRRGVWQAGGLPLEFPVLSTGEFHMRPTAMMFRNLASMDVEEAIRANPLDGVVLLGGCDKTVPALLMGAASADVPAVLVTGGPQLNASWRGETVGSCTDCRRYQAELRAGRITEADWADLQGCIIRSPGHCMTMGTASTMGCVAEALGIAPPGNGATPAPDSRRWQIAEAAGRHAVDLANRDVRPSHLLTPAAFDNAIRVLHAIGGSTNAVIHLVAIAGRLGMDLPLERFDELSRTTPFLLDLKPAGRFLMEDFFRAGGVPALVNELAPLLDLSARTVTGRTLGENCAGARVWDRDVIRPLAEPLAREGGLAVLRGSLAPNGAIIKPTAATPRLLRHRGRAVVFADHDDLNRRIDDPALDVRPDDVLVLRNAGPVGGPGMPEWGFLPIPKKLLAAGVRDMVRISDARMSGTAFGTVVVHVAPESAAGGPLAAVRDGDAIDLDVPNRRLELLVEPTEVARRLAESARRESGAQRGYRWLYARHVLQADAGCDFDFLRAGFRDRR